MELEKQDHCASLHSRLNEMNGLTMKHSEKDLMFKHCSEIIKIFGQLTNEMIEQNEMTPFNAVDAVTTSFCSEIETFISRFKREKQINKNPLYVPPQERAIGNRIEQKFDINEQIEKPVLIQSTLQIVSVISSLKSFFSESNNLNMYLKFQSEHQCIPGVYKYFCCGEVYQSSEFFRSNPNAIQLQLAIDDVEICDPLGSKSNLHKVCAVYFVIRNIPPRFNSKLKNIFLVCVCNAEDLKTKKTDINNIWEIVVDEIKFLEKNGIMLDNGHVLKGTLVSYAADNLGAHIALCLAESFRAIYFCRTCTVSRDESEMIFKDDLEKYRDESHYERMLEVINNSEKVDFKETFGIKRYCALNDLNHFHIFRNFSVDIMHDLNEGVIHSLLQNVFFYLKENKVLNEKGLQDMIKGYQYPMYFRRDKPSILILDKKRRKIGQNSSQIRCLFLNLPFMLARYENNEHLMKIWDCVKWLLRIFQIVYSEVFDENLLKELELCVENFLKTFKELFKCNLLPKHHFMVHYANIIRKMGPLIYMSMIRFDAKHTFLKNVVRYTNNFVNINKTLAVKHQQNMIIKENTFCDKFTNTKKKPIRVDFIRETYGNAIFSHFSNDSMFSEMTSFSFNSLKYARGSIISYKKKLHEIEMILISDKTHYLVAFELEFLGVHEFSQSLEVKKPHSVQFEMIKFHDLLHKKPYCCKFIGSKQYVIIDNRDVMRTL